MTAVTHPRARLPGLSMFGGGRVYVWFTGLALVLAVTSLHWPSTPSYDPWSWLIWGREIFHAITGTGPLADAHLHIAGGSSWKPLPVIFTTVFALFGSAQPNLWLVVARAGAVVTVLMSVKLTVRITRGLVAQSRSGARLAQQSRLAQTVAFTPAVFAGAAALICTTFTTSFPGNMLLGYSEGVMAAAFLIAAERAWDGHYRQAFVLGILPCLDRPEVWPVWALFGLWLMWRDRGARLLVVGLGVLMLCLWGVPQKLGGGSGGLIGLGSHALKNRSRKSAANAAFPFWAELSRTLWPLVLVRLELASLAFIAGTAALLLRTRRRLGSWAAAVRRYPAATAGSLAGLFGFLWWLGVSAETQVGFAGNPRYAVIGSMFICVSGCAAYGWACIGLAALCARGLRWLRRHSRLHYGSSESSLVWLAAAATLVVLVVFALVPDDFTTTMPTVSSIRSEMRYQAELRERYASLVSDAGGPQKVIGCGSVMTNNFEVTMLAWYLQVPIYYVQALAKIPKVQTGPNAVFQAATNSGGVMYPTARFMRDWGQGWKRANGTRYKIMYSNPVRLYMDCSAYSRT
ncbi:MAG TPA: hypothetical protein VG293_05185 [Solirubrobacteraceae bacterium]|nr:hypothetical protein [Solirubrobacteraceae bacterium]